MRAAILARVSSAPGPRGTGLTTQLSKGRAEVAQRGWNDPTCTPDVVPTRSGFVDSGGDVHVVRNEGGRRRVAALAEGSWAAAKPGRRLPLADPPLQVQDP